VNASSRVLPGLPRLTGREFVFAAASIGAAATLLVCVGWRIASTVGFWHWWVPLALLGGVAAADFGSGLVHWGADTWGRDDYPLIGRRVLVPFRVHHINPDDFLHRTFIDTNGDVAFLTLLPLAGLLAVPLDTAWGGPLVVVGFASCAFGGMTNQIHQWAHKPTPPGVVRMLQRCGVLLSRTAHAVHHDRPYDCHYCITTGWCNRPLEAIGFFRRLETYISRTTGARPRHDDRDYETRSHVA
jgi:hypothetical protein